MNILLNVKKENELYSYQSTTGHRSNSGIVGDDELEHLKQSIWTILKH